RWLRPKRDGAHEERAAEACRGTSSSVATRLRVAARGSGTAARRAPPSGPPGLSRGPTAPGGLEDDVHRSVRGELGGVGKRPGGRGGRRLGGDLPRGDGLGDEGGAGAPRPAA